MGSCTAFRANCAAARFIQETVGVGGILSFDWGFNRSPGINALQIAVVMLIG